MWHHHLCAFQSARREPVPGPDLCKGCGCSKEWEGTCHVLAPRQLCPPSPLRPACPGTLIPSCLPCSACPGCLGPLVSAFEVCPLPPQWWSHLSLKTLVTESIHIELYDIWDLLQIILLCLLFHMCKFSQHLKNLKVARHSGSHPSSTLVGGSLEAKRSRLR